MAAPLAKKEERLAVTNESGRQFQRLIWHAHGMSARTQKCGIKAFLKRGYSFAEIIVCSY